MGIDLRDQFDALLKESLEDGLYEQFAKYVFNRIAYHSKTRNLHAVEEHNGFWRVAGRDSAGTVWNIHNPDDIESLDLCQIEIPDDNKL